MLFNNAEAMRTTLTVLQQPKKISIKTHNQEMGGVDLVDQRTAVYLRKHRT